MKFIADFHIHSHYSRATSKQLTPEYLDYYGRLKGVDVIGTGDFTHAGWLEELREKLEPVEQGLFQLKKEYQIDPFFKESEPVRFMLSAEISNIYKKGDKVRKVHNVILSPDFKTAETINRNLENLGGNLKSDGRPILGLDSRDLLEIALEANENIFFIPAHIWTPWFSAMGSKSGFDSIQECYDDLAGHIYAIETGLSTDAPMNWMVSSLDNYTLLSNSDAHSPDKIGRNANWFNTGMSYNEIMAAIKTGEGFIGTIDTYPQAGKYHYDGHRKCNVCYNPVESFEHDNRCPVCNRPLTIGVMNRIAQLCDRDSLEERKNRKPFFPIVPLKEIIAEIEGVGPTSKKRDKHYNDLLGQFGNEMYVLLEKPVAEIAAAGNTLLAEAIERMRERKIYIKEGFDGEYGKITLFKSGEVQEIKAGASLFNDHESAIEPLDSRPMLNFDLQALQQLQKSIKMTSHQLVAEELPVYKKQITTGVLSDLNEYQEAAATHVNGPAIILAGPGTGKTKTITSHIFYLIENEKIPEENILALTFTNKAAKEMSERVAKMFQNSDEQIKSFIGTFHSLGYKIITENLTSLNRKDGFYLIDRDHTATIIQDLTNEKKSDCLKIADRISSFKQAITEENSDSFQYVFAEYNKYLELNNLCDLDDLLWLPVQLFKTNEQTRDIWQDKYEHILVDEYQDTNPIQYQLLQYLIKTDQSNLYVVGDPNQSIYGFRGANVGYIRRFLVDFPAARVYQLKKSYRCSNTILKSSSEVLSTSQPNMLEGLIDGMKIKLTSFPTAASEAEGIARTIEQITGGVGFFSIDSGVVGEQTETELSLSEIAILMRTRQIAGPIKEALRNHNIPFQETGIEPFWKNENWVALFDAIAWVLNPTSYIEKRIPQNIINNDFSAMDKTKASVWIENFVDLLYGISFDMVEKERLINLSKDLDIFGFLKLMKTGFGGDAIDKSSEVVQLITMHASKGLEFDTVFIPALEEGILPYKLHKEDVDIVEEERLLYVAMTRAKKGLYLSHAHQRKIFNQVQNLKASSFFKRIDEENLEKIRQKQRKKKAEDDTQLSLF